MSKKFFVFLCSMFFFILPIQASDELYLGGDSIGIEVNYDGVLVSGTYRFEAEGVTYDPSSQLQAKDIITAVNHVDVKTLHDLQTQLNQWQEPVNEVPITILRNQMQQEVTLTTVYDASTSSFKSGLYVKDKIVGVGTMSYYDPSTQTYGALGHEIMDNDIQEIAGIHSGFIYPANVTSITKAQHNVPGEKHATIDFTKALAQVSENTAIGIYGTYQTPPANVVALPWAKQEEIQVGQATIYTVVSGSQIQAYTIEITRLHHQSSIDMKGIEFRVNDDALLAASNGIVQGMSGSPIVQNGKIIGAVTHVVTANPSNGYGVYIEWMLEKSRNLS